MYLPKNLGKYSLHAQEARNKIAAADRTVFKIFFFQIPSVISNGGDNAIVQRFTVPAEVAGQDL